MPTYMPMQEINKVKRGRPSKSESDDMPVCKSKKQKKKKTMETDEDSMHKEKGEIDADIHKFVSQVDNCALMYACTQTYTQAQAY